DGRCVVFPLQRDFSRKQQNVGILRRQRQRAPDGVLGGLEVLRRGVQDRLGFVIKCFGRIGAERDRGFERLSCLSRVERNFELDALQQIWPFPLRPPRLNLSQQFFRIVVASQQVQRHGLRQKQVSIACENTRCLFQQRQRFLI